MKSGKVNSNSSLMHEESETEPPSGQVSVLKSTRKKLVAFPKINNTPISPQSWAFINHHFPNITESDWNDWQWQLRNSYTGFQQLSSFLNLSENEVRSSHDKKKLPVRITPYYASLLDPDNPTQALRRTMVPVYDELIVSPQEKPDPLGEEEDSPVPHIVHRYPDRVLFLITGFCAAYCRYCTRSHMVSKKDKCHSNRSEWDAALDYIWNHPEVRDVLLSGGDPLTLPDYRLEYLLSNLRAIPHVSGGWESSSPTAALSTR